MGLNYDALRGILSKITLERPAIAAGLTGGAGMLLAAGIAPELANLASKASPFGKDLGYVSPEQKSKMRRRFGLVGGLAGSAWAWPLLIKNMGDQGILKGLVSKFPKQADNAADVLDYSTTRSIVQADGHLSPAAKGSLISTLDAAMRKSEPKSKLHGMITTTDLIKGLAGGGLGYAGTALTGSVLGSLFGLPTPMLRDLSRTGALAGALLGSGVIS